VFIKNKQFLRIEKDAPKKWQASFGIHFTYGTRLFQQN